MFDIRRLSLGLALALGVSTGNTDRAFAQQVRNLDLGVAFGPSPYDLSGTGTAFAAGVRAPWQAQSWLVIEPGIGFLSYEEQFGDRLTYLFPELSIQGQLRLGRARPFLGGGAGGAFVVGGEGETVETLHGVVGTRVDMSPVWTLSGEMRVRAVRPWSGSTVDFLFGVNRRLR
jgi:hypothetical protein